MEDQKPRVGDVLMAKTTGIKRRVTKIDEGRPGGPWIELVEINSGMWNGWQQSSRMYDSDRYELVERG